MLANIIECIKMSSYKFATVVKSFTNHKVAKLNYTVANLKVRPRNLKYKLHIVLPSL